MSGQSSAGPTLPLRYSEPAGRWVLAATVLGSSLAFLDSTAVNIALPAIDGDLSAGARGLTWTVNAYALALAAFVLIGGSLGDRFGRRRVFLVGVVWFGVASLACALSTGIAMLITFRAAQGLGAALLTPGALALLHASFRREDRSRAIGAWSGLGGIGAAAGPFLGGWLVDLGSWRWIFLINVPLVVAVLVITARHVPGSRDESAAGRGLDLGGAFLAAVALGLVTYALSTWSEHGPAARWMLGAGLVALLAFVIRERTAAEPMMPLEVLAAARFGPTNAVTFLVYAGLGGVLFWLVVTLQVVSGWTALSAGLSLLPITVVMLLFSPQAGILGDRLGPRVPMTAGPLVGALGVLLLTRIGPDATFLDDVLLPVTLLAAGLTMTVTPLTTTALGAVDEQQAGLAGGINNAVARTGGLVLVAVLPAVTGLTETGFSDPVALEAAFGTAMMVCAVLLALGGVLAAALLGARSAGRRARRVLPPQADRFPHHCAVDATPLAVADRSSPEHHDKRLD